jgi:hypothetical protein
MTLYKGPFGSIFGGTEPVLMFERYILNGLVQARQKGCMYTRSLRAVVKTVTTVSSANVDREKLNVFEEYSIGVDANPKCGNCQCGQCLVRESQCLPRWRNCTENGRRTWSTSLMGCLGILGILVRFSKQNTNGTFPERIWFQIFQQWMPPGREHSKSLRRIQSGTPCTMSSFKPCWIRGLPGSLGKGSWKAGKLVEVVTTTWHTRW